MHPYTFHIREWLRYSSLGVHNTAVAGLSARACCPSVPIDCAPTADVNTAAFRRVSGSRVARPPVEQPLHFTPLHCTVWPPTRAKCGDSSPRPDPVDLLPVEGWEGWRGRGDWTLSAGALPSVYRSRIIDPAIATLAHDGGGHRTRVGVRLWRRWWCR